MSPFLTLVGVLPNLSMTWTGRRPLIISPFLLSALLTISNCCASNGRPILIMSLAGSYVGKLKLESVPIHCILYCYPNSYATSFVPYPIIDSIWLANGSLLVGAGHQMFLYAQTPSVDTGRTEWGLFEYVARINGRLEDYHPQMLLQCLLWG